MPTRFGLLPTLLALLVTVTSATAENAPAKQADAPGRIGQAVPNFILPDHAGRQVALADFKDARFVIAVFMGTRCPIGNAYVPTLLDLQKDYRGKSVRVIGINPNLSDSVKDISTHVEKFKLTFPVLVDSEQRVADLFGAQRTPEVFVLDRRRRIRYRGRIDDRFGYLYKREKSRRQELKSALDELLGDKAVSVSITKPVGCLITRQDRAKQAGSITYARHVSRILQQKCAGCHHANTAAPFSLTSYDEAKNWSATIKETVVQRRMPPWHADPRYGHFSNDMRLTQAEIDTLVAWIDDGTPMGKVADLPPKIQYSDGWMIGKPDVVFKMPREFTVKAKGTVRYQYFVTKMDLKEDVWIQAAEARPGNRSVVHHIIVYHRPAGSGKNRRRQSIVGTAPGEDPEIWPLGTGRKIPAGSELVWQLHYTPTGKVETVRSSLGLIFCKTPPRRSVKGKAAINFRFKIPPGASNHRVVSSVDFSRDAELLSLMPHMHLRGKDFLYRAHYPDGKKEILLSVPGYDFNWQHRYRFAKPFRVPAGTKIECVAHFDNSIENPANPDPKKLIGWGDQTWNEMMIGFVNYVDASRRSRR
ncbi:MAG: redoxin domain-containing protein [Planctomycetaceae bacterium]